MRNKTKLSKTIIRLYLVALLLVAVGGFAGCVEEIESDCGEDANCPDDDTPCGDDDNNNDDNDESPTTPTPNDWPVAPLEARINYSDAWSMWKLQEQNNDHGDYSGAVFTFDENDIPIISETDRKNGTMILYIYAPNVWTKKNIPTTTTSMPAISLSTIAANSRC